MAATHRLLLRPDRKRQIPSRFSWLDQQLVRAGHLRTFSDGAGKLYLFLNVVGDANGLSWYSDSRICLEAALSASELVGARDELVGGDYIAYDGTFYQVLSLPRGAGALTPKRVGCSTSAPPPCQWRPPSPEESAEVRVILGLPPLED